ncbi:MAG: serine/threonine-protein kinase RsbW [Solirubrobacteraceae bacterium]|nr:serine/threonine-protein kinase RsbW [Solirubrobacteraceae bacterium]
MSDGTTTLAREALLAGPVAQVVIDGHGEVVVASDRAVALLGVDACAAGALLADVELRALAVRAAVTGVADEIRTEPLAICITPLGGGAGAALTWIDATDGRQLGDTRRQLRATVAELSSLSEQLHLSNGHLRAVSDDLGTANAELEALNDELRHRALELAELDATLHDVVRASGSPALVTDAHGRILVWTPEATRLWSLPIEHAEGRTLAELDLGAGARDLARAVTEALQPNAPPIRTVLVRDRDGAPVACDLHAARPAGDVVVFMRRGDRDSRPRVSGQGRLMAPPGSHAFELRVSAVPASVGELRHALSTKLQSLPVPTALVEDISLAVSEAATNAVLHAYLGASQPGPLCLYARLMDDTVHVVVRDHGRGMTPRPDSPGLGLGLPLMTRLADAVQISTHPEGGTEVRMTFTVERDDPHPRFAHS